MVVALTDVLNERERQQDKWGEQNHADGTGGAAFVAEADFRRAQCEEAFALGVGTWKDILLEEVWEAMAERDPEKLREELIHVAAVAVSWVEGLDRRAQKCTIEVTHASGGATT